jgi:hypothetical protein
MARSRENFTFTFLWIMLIQDGQFISVLQFIVFISVDKEAGA